MPQAPSRLPPIGPLLGAAYDRAIEVFVRSSPIVVALIALALLVRVPSEYPGLDLFYVAFIVWSFFAMANAIRKVIDPTYRMDRGRAADMTVTALVVVGSIIIVEALRAAVESAATTSTSLIASIFATGFNLWLVSRFFCAPAIGALGTPGVRSLSESARLTSIGLWKTAAIVCANTVIAAAIYYAIDIAATAQNVYWSMSGITVYTAYVSSALVLIGEMYVIQAAAILSCLWLKALEEAQPVTPDSA